MTLVAVSVAASGRLLRAAVLGLVACQPVAQAQDAASLRTRYAELRESLSGTPFQRSLHLESREASGDLEGDIYARVEQSFAVVGPALRGMDQWCDILMLHLNVKGCRGTRGQGGELLSLYVGRKFDQPLADAYRVDFGYRVAASQPDYQQVVLNADTGPMGTSHYRIMLEVVALDSGRSFLHLSYSYHYGVAARLSVQAYLATIGRNKLGFSIVGHNSRGLPVYIGGTRGVIERNTMRYFLAIEAFLGALSVPAPERLEKRLNDWYAGVERYPLQLHELERSEYLEMKRGETRRQLTEIPAGAADPRP